jgi:chromosomal replication initiation ATPase DnaA
MLLDDDQLTRLAHKEAACAVELPARLNSSGPFPPEGRTREGGGAGTDSAQDAHATLKQIIAITSRYFAVTQTALTGPSRRTTLVLARNIVVQLARRHTALSYADIGRSLGGRDHTTIMHADRRLIEQLASDPALQQTLDELNRLVT